MLAWASCQQSQRFVSINLELLRQGYAGEGAVTPRDGPRSATDPAPPLGGVFYARL